MCQYPYHLPVFLLSKSTRWPNLLSLLVLTSAGRVEGGGPGVRNGDVGLEQVDGNRRERLASGSRRSEKRIAPW